MATPFKGRIKCFSEAKGFGFIVPGSGEEIFFHKRAVKSGQPVEGAQVEGEWAPGDKGPKAVVVRVTSSAAGSPNVIVTQKPYYADAQKKQIRPELLCEEAEAMAKQFSSERLNNSQIRRFFEEVRTLEKIVQSKGFDVARPLIRMLAAKAHYAKGRSKIGDKFMLYLSDNAKAIQDREDFAAFVKGFEAIVGYFLFLNPERNR